MVSQVIFYAVNAATTGSFPKGWAWLVFAAPGLLFLFLSRIARKPKLASA